MLRRYDANVLPCYPLKSYGGSADEGAHRLVSSCSLLLLPLLELPVSPSVWTWCLFCEAAAEETPVLAMADGKPKEGVKTENNDHINLKVAGQDGPVVQFKMKRHTPLSKLTKAYCERKGLSQRQIRFQFDGQPINESHTCTVGNGGVCV
ncbi:hypothetical protein ACRRTK_016310 [Alexandromys fortis]